ncbi:hypothetical protein C8F01DRAFT_1092079 [Mycena amicta]|nr:hypothetical protein C8F01DRAFT_1092079 [Mycena amicta]
MDESTYRKRYCGYIHGGSVDGTKAYTVVTSKEVDGYNHTVPSPDDDVGFDRSKFGQGKLVEAAPEVDKITKLIQQELKDTRPLNVADAATWTLADVNAWTKDSYRSIKKDWVKFNDEETARSASYAEKANLNAGVVAATLDAEFLSDEWSGPEDQDEAKDEWKIWMAALAGLVNLTAEELEGWKFVEVEELEWRSNQANAGRQQTRIVEGVHAEAESARSTESQGFVRYRCVRHTGRQSVRVPHKTPFDFMINLRWLDANRDKAEMNGLLDSWGTFGNPDGFGEEGAETDGQQASGGEDG